MYYGHWLLHLEISHTRQYDLIRALASASCDISFEIGVRFVTGIGFCIL